PSAAARPAAEELPGATATRYLSTRARRIQTQPAALLRRTGFRCGYGWTASGRPGARCWLSACLLAPRWALVLSCRHATLVRERGGEVCQCLSAGNVRTRHQRNNDWRHPGARAPVRGRCSIQDCG